MRKWATSALLAATIAAAQEPSPAPTFRSGIQLVQVSVVAQDKKGKAVTDLRREDFQILDNGSPREIRLFLAGDSNPALAETKTPGIFTNRSAPDAASYSGYSVILLDNLFTDFGDTETGFGVANARLSALKALQSIPAGGKVAIYATGRKLQVVCEFSSDRDLLHRQLERWKASNDTPGGANRTTHLRIELNDEKFAFALEHGFPINMDGFTFQGPEFIVIVADKATGLTGSLHVRPDLR